jgi:hypothetical protein
VLAAPVIAGWMLGVGALVNAGGVPAWLVSAVGLEAVLGAALGAFLLTRSAAGVAWWTATVGCAAGWLAYAAAFGPWSWAGEVSLALPALILAPLWPLARAGWARRAR